MQVRKRNFRTLWLVPMLAIGLGMQCPPDSNLNMNMNDNTDDASRLFVVNNNSGITSYGDPAGSIGNATPLTDLPAGASTNIFQPRSLVVTTGGQLIVARQNGGLSVHDNALTATGGTLANRTVEGVATLLDAPIALAYDATNDRLYVGGIDTDEGILVFDDVSANTFTGNLAPNRKFNPPDRAPSNNMSMTIDSMALDENGVLYVSDTSGLNQNSSRILVFQNPGAANGETAPDRTIISLNWGGIEDIFVDLDDRLYVVDGSNQIEVIDDASTAENLIVPSRTITLTGTGIDLHGILAQGRGFVADSGNHAIAMLLNIGTLSGMRTADGAITGNDTELSTPRHMFLIED